MQTQTVLPEPRITPKEKCEPIGCQRCGLVVGWTDGNGKYLTWKDEPICEDCYAEKIADLPLPEFLAMIDRMMSYERKVIFKEDMIIIQYDTIRSEVQDAAKLLECRGASYSISSDGNLLTFVVAPVNGGKLDLA
jgi:hypothetical protein